jgi:hypothetical protein
VWNGSGGWCAGQCVQGGGGGGSGGGLCTHETRGGGVGLGQNQQPSCHGSVAGAPCETVVGDGA